jgi:integrase
MMPYHELLEAFLHASEAKACYRTYCNLCDQHLKQWQEMPTFAQIEDWHMSVKAKPHHANKGLNLLKAMFSWAQRRGLYTGQNPATGVRRHPTMSRARVMSSEEVRLLLSCTDLIQHDKLATILLVLLLTGCRLSEAREMKREHVNLVTGAWFQPRTKNGKPHTTYLPIQARQAIGKLTGCGPYVFAGLYDHCWSRAGVEKTWRQVRGALGLQDVRLHDFRRTLSTHLYRYTKDEYLVKRCINHVNRSVTAIYVRISEEEVAKALQAQADRFYALTMPPTVPRYTRRSSDVAREVTA